MTTNNKLTIRKVAIFWQTDAETGGNAGWAYNAIDTDDEHTSDGFEVGDDDDGSESLDDVRESFSRVWPEVAATVYRWEQSPEGGWRGLCRVDSEVRI